MDAKVVDASVLAALVFGEPRSEEALRLLHEQMLYAPFLLGYELAQVAVKKITRHPQECDNIIEALSLALNLEIQWVEVDYVAVVRLALDIGLTAYDASYIHASRSLGIPLATFDEALKRKCDI